MMMMMVSEVEVDGCRRRWGFWRWRWRSSGVGGGGGGVVEVVAEQWCRRCRWCQEEVNVCEEKTWVHVCFKKRSRRPFLMKGLRKNKQAADIKRLRASASRRHKWPEVLLAKKQTEPWCMPIRKKSATGMHCKNLSAELGLA
ncbi:hypothetical protein Hanom_Chr15g01366501 [Helianthus anomalus]